jgi:hypothetical protein
MEHPAGAAYMERGGQIIRANADRSESRHICSDVNAV